MQVRLFFASKPFFLLLILLLSLLTFGCAPLNYVTHLYMTDIESQDLDALRDGNLGEVRERYELREKSKNSNEWLNLSEQTVLCDIYIKHVSIGKAQECLKNLDTKYNDADDSIVIVKERIAGKQALLAYIQRNFESASALTINASTYGGKYVHALAEASMNNPEIALNIAGEWRASYEPIKIFLAANLYLATEKYDEALKTLNDSERRVARDYSLSGAEDIFGFEINPAPIKFDLFGEFRFGLLDTYSYAPPGNVYVEYVLAKCKKELGHKDEAIKRFNKIISLSKIAAYRDVYWLTLYELGQIAEQDGKQQEAIDFYKKSIDIIESVRSSITTDAGKIGFVGDKQNVYASLIDLLAITHKASEAFEYSERSRSRSLVDLLAGVQKFGRHKNQSSDAEQALAEYEKSEINYLDAHIKTLDEIELAENRKNKQRTELQKNDMLLASLEIGQTIKIANIQNKLGAKDALLSYYRTGTTLRLFMVKKDLFMDFDLGDIKIESKVEDFNNKMDAIDYFYEKISIDDKNKNIGDDLYAELFSIEKALYKDLFTKEMENKLEGIDKLIIIPFGGLHLLPFSVLTTNDSKYLLEKFTLTTLPSASILNYFTPNSKPETGILIISNSNTELTGAEKEARSIAEIIQPAELLLGEQATKTNLLKNAPRFPHIHFAGHGKFDYIDPLESYIALAGSDNLRVKDLFQINDPWDSKLVVLSACKSAFKKVNNGQELIGLQNGFLYTGAENYVGALWDIRDRKSSLFIEKLYEFVEKGFKPAEALRKAQQFAIEPSQSWPQRVWGAFTAVGAP